MTSETTHSECSVILGATMCMVDFGEENVDPVSCQLIHVMYISSCCFFMNIYL